MYYKKSKFLYFILNFLAFGGITIFNELINKSLKEEFVILILGPIFQILFYFILCFFKIQNTLITNYHYSLLMFNLIITHQQHEQIRWLAFQDCNQVSL